MNITSKNYMSTSHLIKACENCTFYDVIRTEYRLGNCALDHFDEPIEVSADHSCDHFLEANDE